MEKFQNETKKQRRANYYKKNAALINILTFLIIVFSFAIAILLFDIANYAIEQNKTKKLMEEAQTINQQFSENEPTQPPQASVSSLSEPTEETANETPTQTPAPTENPTFVALRETFANDEIVAFIKIDGTNIDYPVLQAADNEFYLTRDIKKEKNVNGSIFMDYENDVAKFDKNTVIYGHNMKNKTMFHNVRYFAEKSFYDEHKFINLQTPYENTTWEIFSFYSTDTKFNYIQTKFASDEAFKILLEQFVSKSEYETGVSVSESDDVLTLSTCENNLAGDKRYVIHAKLLK